MSDWSRGSAGRTRGSTFRPTATPGRICCAPPLCGGAASRACSALAQGATRGLRRLRSQRRPTTTSSVLAPSSTLHLHEAWDGLQPCARLVHLLSSMDGADVLPLKDCCGLEAEGVRRLRIEGSGCRLEGVRPRRELDF